MNKKEQALREKAIRDYLKQMTLQEFLRIKSEKIKKAILDAFIREYDQYEVFND